MTDFGIYENMAVIALALAISMLALAAFVFVKLDVRDALRHVFFSGRRVRRGGFRIIERRLITFDGEDEGR